MNSGSAVREGFSRDDRLRKRREFEECYASGVRVSGRFFQVFVRKAPAPARIGISVPKRVGNAVTRNRLKRRVREIFRRDRELLPGVGAIVVHVRPSAAEAAFEPLREEFCRLVARSASRRT